MTGRLLLAMFFFIAGCLHFIFPEAYLRMVPPPLPSPRALVLISGVAEIMGGIGLLLPQWQRSAAWGLIVLLIAVFPSQHLYGSGARAFCGITWTKLGAMAETAAAASAYLLGVALYPRLIMFIRLRAA